MASPTPQRAGLYYQKLPTTWWLHNPRYFRFMIREVTSVFIAIFLVVFLVELYQLSKGPDAYSAFVARLSSPGWILFHLVALAFALYHTVTWFNLTGVVQVVRIGDRQVPPAAIVGGTFAAWAVVSIIIFCFLARG
jgi:fumarate reductase subunit C